MDTEIETTKKEPLYEEAKRLVIEKRRSNILFLQRSFGLGYNHAARYVEAMEHDGVLGPIDRAGNRPILVPPNKD